MLSILSSPLHLRDSGEAVAMETVARMLQVKDRRAELGECEGEGATGRPGQQMEWARAWAIM